MLHLRILLIALVALTVINATPVKPLDTTDATPINDLVQEGDNMAELLTADDLQDSDEI
jgi:hypothetical protein